MQGNHRGYGERKANICIMEWLVAKQSSYRFFFYSRPADYSYSQQENKCKVLDQTACETLIYASLFFSSFAQKENQSGWNQTRFVLYELKNCIWLSPVSHIVNVKGGTRQEGDLDIRHGCICILGAPNFEFSNILLPQGGTFGYLRLQLHYYVYRQEHIWIHYNGECLFIGREDRLLLPDK